MATTEQVTAAQRSYRNRRYRQWKIGLRIAISLFNAIAIICASWLVTNIPSFSTKPYIRYFELDDSLTGVLVVLCVSFGWCIFCIAVPFLFKNRQEIHPGLAVGFDLILCGAIITVGIFSLTGTMSVFQFGSTPSYLSDPGYHRKYSGNYYLAPNNTWVYNITYAAGDGSSYYNYTLGRYVFDTGDIHNVTRECTPLFSSCVAQDAEVNKLWQQKTVYEGTDVVMISVLWLDVVLHLVLFVWACVDTHIINSEKKKTREEVIEARVIANLNARGILLNDMNESGVSKVPPPAYTREE